MILGLILYGIKLLPRFYKRMKNIIIQNYMASKNVRLEKKAKAAAEAKPFLHEFEPHKSKKSKWLK